MIQIDFINFLKHAALPKRAWQGHDTSVGRVDVLVSIAVIYKPINNGFYPSFFSAEKCIKIGFKIKPHNTEQ